jgi:hypothetical protein
MTLMADFRSFALFFRSAVSLESRRAFIHATREESGAGSGNRTRFGVFGQFRETA